MQDEICPTSGWHLVDAHGHTLTDSMDAPMTRWFLTQAVCAFPAARAVVARNVETYWATEDVLNEDAALAKLVNLRAWMGEEDAFAGQTAEVA